VAVRGSQSSLFDFEPETPQEVIEKVQEQARAVVEDGEVSVDV
jgi:hypothetical protein